MKLPLRSLATLTLTVIALATLTACAAGNTGSSGSAPEARSDSARQATSTGSKYVIGVAIPNLPDLFHQSVYYGIWKEAQERGTVELVMYDAGGFANLEKQISQIEDLIQRPVHAIIISPTNSAGVAPAVKKALDKRIGVVAYGSRVAVEGPPFVGSDQKELGAHQAEYILDAFKDQSRKVKLAALPGPAGVTWSEDRYRAFVEELRKNPNIEIVATRWTQSDRQSGLTTTEDLLQRFPDLDAIYTGTDTIGNGAAQALVAAKKDKMILLTTSVMSPDTRGNLEKGVIWMSAAQQSVMIGRRALQVALDLLDGKKVESTNFIRDLVVTKDNVGKVDESTINAPAGWKP